MKIQGKHVLLTVCIIIAAILVAIDLFMLFSKDYGYFNFWLFWIAWAVMAFGIVKFYINAPTLESHH